MFSTLMNCNSLCARLQTRQWSENTIRKEKRYRAVRRSDDIRTGLSVKEVDVVVTPRVREEVQRLVLCSAPSVPQPVVQSRRRPLLGPSPG